MTARETNMQAEIDRLRAEIAALGRFSTYRVGELEAVVAAQREALDDARTQVKELAKGLADVLAPLGRLGRLLDAALDAEGVSESVSHLR